MSKRFKDAVEAYSAKLKAQVEDMQKTKAQGQSLVQQLQEWEDIQAGLSNKIQDLTLVTEKNQQILDRVVYQKRKAEVGHPEAQPQGNLREQPEATPAKSASPIMITPKEDTDEEVPALIASAMEDFAPDEELNKDNLDAPIKGESDSPVEEQITEAMVEQE